MAMTELDQIVNRLNIEVEDLVLMFSYDKTRIDAPAYHEAMAILRQATRDLVRVDKEFKDRIDRIRENLKDCM